LAVWIAGLEIGLRSVAREPILGLKRIGLPVSYWRSREFAYVWRQLSAPPGARVLDVGSPKDLACMLARHRGYEVVSTDILPAEVELSRRSATAQGLAGKGPGKVRSELQDARSLSYPDSSFDAAYTVSVLEHIPDRGDSLALRELVRVVKPGGRVVVTTPYDRRYRETFVNGPVYERQQVGSEPVFFERHYDDGALSERLLTATSARVADVQYWGERAARVERFLGMLGRLRLAVLPLEALLATAFLHQLDPHTAGHPMAVFFTLEKP
jgi:SAM-dependent methyltransferase